MARPAPGQSILGVGSYSCTPALRWCAASQPALLRWPARLPSRTGCRVGPAPAQAARPRACLRPQVALAERFSQRWAAAGHRTRAYSMHPGWTETEGVKTRCGPVLPPLLLAPQPAAGMAGRWRQAPRRMLRRGQLAELGTCPPHACSILGCYSARNCSQFFYCLLTQIEMGPACLPAASLASTAHSRTGYETCSRAAIPPCGSASRCACCSAAGNGLGSAPCQRALPPPPCCPRALGRAAPLTRTGSAPPSTACARMRMPERHGGHAAFGRQPLVLACCRMVPSWRRGLFTWTAARRPSTCPWRALGTAALQWTGSGRRWRCWRRRPCLRRRRAEQKGAQRVFTLQLCAAFIK